MMGPRFLSPQTLRQCICAISVAGALLASSGAAQAAYIVDTGQPSGASYVGHSLYSESDGSFQSLGGRFTLAESQTISVVEGWIYTYAAGDVAVKLWAGAPSESNSPLFSSVSTFSALTDFRWAAFSGLNWSVGPGTYTLTFDALTGFGGQMRNGAPSPLETYYYRNATTSGWQESPRNFGVRITSAVPEPQTYALLLAGLAVLGWTARRRT